MTPNAPQISVVYNISVNRGRYSEWESLKSISTVSSAFHNPGKYPRDFRGALKGNGAVKLVHGWSADLMGSVDYVVARSFP